MAAPQETPADDASGLAKPSLSDLYAQLDSLWTIYLGSLDSYATSQKLLRKHMSAGFLSLARANFNARNGVGRFGKDFYHDGAVATRRVEIREVESAKAKVDVVRWEEPKAVESSDDEFVVIGKEDGELNDEPSQELTPPATPAPENGPDDDTHNTRRKEDDVKAETNVRMTEDDGKENKKSKPKPSLQCDPLRWFGILVPRELRSAQASFSSVIDESLALSVNAARGMRETEIEIRKLRKEIRRAEKSEHNG